MNASTTALAEEASHAFFKSTAFVEFAAEPDNPEKRRAVEDSLRSYGPVNCSLIADQLTFAPCVQYVKELLDGITSRISRNG